MSNHNYKLICEETISDFLRKVQKPSIGQRLRSAAVSAGRGIVSVGKEVGKAIGSEVERQGRDLIRRMHEEELRHLERVEKQVLIPHYSKHLGISEAKIRTILDYPENPPILPVAKSIGGKLKFLPSDLRDYQSKLADHMERKRLMAHIEGLSKSIPEIAHIRNSINSRRQKAYQSIERIDPMSTEGETTGLRRTEIMQRELEQKILEKRKAKLAKKQKK